MESKKYSSKNLLQIFCDENKISDGLEEQLETIIKEAKAEEQNRLVEKIRTFLNFL